MSESGATSSESGAVDGATEAAERQPPEAVEKGNTDCPVPPPSKACPTGFHVEAPVRVLRLGGKDVQLVASDLKGFSGGVFTWKTTSPRLYLSGERGRSIRVSGKGGVSEGLDAEVVEVTRTAPDCAPVTRTVNLTVAKVTFSKSSLNKYGYDDMDGKPRWLSAGDPFHYISIKEEDVSQVQVTIEGGLVGTDFEFACASSLPGQCIPAAPSGSAIFDLVLNAGRAQTAQVLQARYRGGGDDVFGEIGVCVYPEKVLNVVVGKFENPLPFSLPNPPGRRLLYPKRDFVGYAPKYNDGLRDAVVKFNVFDLFTDGSVATYHFSSGTGTFRFDINAGGGPDREGLLEIMMGRTRTAATLTPNCASMVRVAIVPALYSYYKLAKAASKDQTEVWVVGADAFFNVGDKPPLGSGATKEDLKITGKETWESTGKDTWDEDDKGKCKLLCEPLENDHAVGQHIEFPAAAWSTDPIILVEGSEAQKDASMWAVPHEVSHREFKLWDIEDMDNIMNYALHGGSHHLRFNPRKLHYEQDQVQNQWQQIHYPKKR